MRKNKLILLETINEAEYYLKRLEPKECEAVTLTPDIRAYLKRHGVNSFSTADFIGTDEHRTVIDRCSRLEAALKNGLAGTPQPKKYFINTYFHFLRLIYRHLVWNIELLDKCLNGYQKVYAFRYPKPITGSPWVEDGELYIGCLAEKLCRIKKIDYVAIGGLARPRSARVSSARDRGSRLTHFIGFHLNRWIARRHLKDRTVLVPGFKYNLVRVCDELKRKDKDIKIWTFNIGRLGVYELLQPMAALFKKNAAEDYSFPVMTFGGYFAGSYDNKVVSHYLEKTLAAVYGTDSDHRGVELGDLIRLKLLDDLNPYMLDLDFKVFSLRKAIETLKPRYIISQMNFGINGALGEISRELGIPSVLISHGSHVLMDDKYGSRENEIMAGMILFGDYHYFAAQSPLAKELLLKLGADPARIVSILPKLWGREVVKKVRDRPKSLTIVHAGSFKLRHNRWYIYGTADEYLKEMVDLAEAVSRHNNLNLILKVRPDIYELSVETIRAYLPPARNVKLETRRTFLDVLGETDLLVSFSSTTIEEALNNRVPVLLYGGAGRYAHLPAKPFTKGDRIDKAVSFVANNEALEDYLTQLSEGATDFAVPEIEFAPYLFSKKETADLADWLLVKGGKQ